TAVVCQMARDLSGPVIKGQVLIYPVTDGTFKQPSIDRLAHAPILTREMMECFINYYARDKSDIQQPYFSPLFADDLSNLPPALVITAQYDPLHDDGHAYADRLKKAGNTVQTIDYPGMVHGFLSFPGFCSLAKDAYAEISVFVKNNL
ncbi:MAG: alpha/beta hydrolase, partial [bacterium]|nr:alpha/beta hydrolase [bacterium]